MKKMRDQFPWLDVPLKIQDDIELAMPQFLLQEPAGKGRKLMKCTCCGNAGIHEPVGRHKSYGICPFCMERVQIIDHARLRDGSKSLERYCNAMIFRAVDGILWAIDARATRSLYRESWDGPDFRTDLSLYVFSVYRFEPGEAEQWKWELSYNGKHGWYHAWAYHKTPAEPPCGGFLNSGSDTYALYGTDALEETSVRYCAIEEFFPDWYDGGELRGAIRYLRSYCWRPKLEYVVKWGLDDVAVSYVNYRRTMGRMVNWKADTPWDFLRISKADWMLYRESGVRNAEALCYNRKYFHLPMDRFLKLMRKEGRSWERWKDAAKDLCGRGVSLERQVRYLSKQSVTGDFARAVRYWKDYLEMAEACGRDVSAEGAIMPRSLIEAHEQMVELQNAIRREQEMEALRKQTEGYRKRREALERKYAYQSGGLEIRVPESGEEIVREGNVLKICVGGYAARHLSGQTTILFLRHARRPDRPYVCIEIDEKTNRIVQIHGYRNEYIPKAKHRPTPPGKKHEAFLKEWLAWVSAGSHRTKKTETEETA